MRISLLVCIVAVRLCRSQVTPPNRSTIYSESHVKLDNLLHTTSHQVLEAQAAGQALKELEHNLENYVAWSAHNIAVGLQTMPISGHAFTDLQRSVGALGHLLAGISDQVGQENSFIQTRTSHQISKLSALNDDLKQLKSALERLQRSVSSSSSNKDNESGAVAAARSSFVTLSYAAPKIFGWDPFNWMTLALFELLIVGVALQLLYPRSASLREECSQTFWNYA